MIIKILFPSALSLRCHWPPIFDFISFSTWPFYSSWLLTARMFLVEISFKTDRITNWDQSDKYNLNQLKHYARTLDKDGRLSVFGAPTGLGDHQQ